MAISKSLTRTIGNDLTKTFNGKTLLAPRSLVASMESLDDYAVNKFYRLPGELLNGEPKLARLRNSAFLEGLKKLNPSIERINDINPVLFIDMNTCGKRETSRTVA